MSSSLAHAEGGASCVPSRSAENDAAIDTLAADPASLLSQYGDGGGGLTSEVRNIAIRRPDAIPKLVGLGSGNANQQAAVGAGLGAAAMICIRSQPDAARAIQLAVVQNGTSDVMRAFASLTGDLETAAVGGGASYTPGPSLDTADSVNGGGPFRPRANDPVGGVIPSASAGFLAGGRAGSSSSSSRRTVAGTNAGFSSVSPFR